MHPCVDIFKDFLLRNRLEGGTNASIRNPGLITKMIAMAIYMVKLQTSSPPDLVDTFQRNRWLKYYNVYINHDPVMTLTYFTMLQGQHWSPMHLNGGWGLLKCHLGGKSCWKWAVGLYVIFFEKRLERSGSSSTHLLIFPGQCTCINHSIQTSSPLKLLGQTMPNFKRSIYRKGGGGKKPGHMTKMAAMPIYHIW